MPAQAEIPMYCMNSNVAAQSYCAAKAGAKLLAEKFEDGVRAAVVGCGPVSLIAILVAQTLRMQVPSVYPPCF